MEFIIRLANINFLVQSVYNILDENVKHYIVEDKVKPDIEIHVTRALLDAEFERLHKINEDILSYTAIEMILVQRTIAEILPQFNTFLLHGAAIAFDHESYIFTGKSGIGKSTHIKQWIDNVDESFVVNGDKPYIIVNQSGAYTCGTPWCGKEKYETNTVVPLKSIVLMERSENNKIVEVSFRYALPKLLEQIYRPADATQMRSVLNLLMKLKDHVSFYVFYFNNFKEDAFHTSFNELTKR